jgi:DNA polymerase elongation subunit (family B)
MKILLLDIETSPNVAYVWGLWKQNINISHIIDAGSVMCWAAKWLGEEEVMFGSVRQGHRKMLKRVHKLLEEADAVVHYNGARFDIPTLNKEFLLLGFTPPASFQQVDLLRTARTKFRFPSNKLDYIAKALGVGGKTKHAGFQLWVDCLAGSQPAWVQMEEYNKNDVVLLEKVYYKLLPWIKTHPNLSVYNDTPHSCPSCGSLDVTKRGFHYTMTMKYQRYQCKSCGTWSRDKTGAGVKEGLTHVS